MALSTTLKLKIFYFEIEILEEQAYLLKNGFDCSLEAVRNQLQKAAGELYIKSNLLVPDSYYEQRPFRLAIVMEGTELKKSEAISSDYQLISIKRNLLCLW
ncbi:hypothetical protein SAMN06265348_11936 [Pedobacter westerhofensis]|uniref:Uncharacterized protein n=1 Tax=Pedobacter westerhofensis TaxID=425512 RepID=A0A521FSC5_9SPHI|nr:hypothetical protein [Pedobacter westerhofensis]SMO99026.1 hypothetical protein SAMN06265348_11936 [Pedobacter westerhofensis]